EDIFTQGLKIKEPEIIDVLLPGLKQEVLGIGFVQKQTDAGEKSRFKAIVAVGTGRGSLELGAERQDKSEALSTKRPYKPNLMSFHSAEDVEAGNVDAASLTRSH